MTARNKDGNGAAARLAGVSLLDKTTFFRWAQDTYQLDGGEQYVLSVIVFDLLGLEDGKAHNAWTTLGVLGTSCHLSRRAVQRVLDRLKELGLVVHHGVAGRGGRTLLHVPGVVDAAKLLKRRQLRDGTKDEPEPNGHDTSAEPRSKRCRPRRLKKVEKASSTTDKRCRPRRLNPLKESLEGYDPIERAPGAAGSGPSGLNLDGEGKGAYGPEDEADALTRPRQRLLKRLEGLCKKADLRDDGFTLQVVLSEDPDEKTVRYWLKLQRQKKDDLLFRHMSQAIADHYRLNAAKLGRKLAAKTEPEPARPPAPEAKPTPPPASPHSPSRPPPAVNGAAPPRPTLRTVADAIREPEHKPRPACSLVYSRDAYAASGARLGIPLKGALC